MEREQDPPAAPEEAVAKNASETMDIKVAISHGRSTAFAEITFPMTVYDFYTHKKYFQEKLQQEVA